MPTDACTLSAASSFGPDRVTKIDYDAAGQTLHETRALGTAQQQFYATYTYTLNGDRATVLDANNNLSTYSYDGFDRLSKLQFPVPTLGAGVSSATDFEAYGYDSNNNRTGLQLRSGETIATTYDALNRDIVKDIPGGTAADVYSSYDLMGRRLTAHYASAGGSGVDYSYDLAGRLLSETTFGRALTYQVDQAGNRTRLTWPDTNFAQYTYDAMNRMSQVRENGATTGVGLLATYAYDTLGRRGTISRGNGAATTFSYDDGSRLSALAQDLASTSQDLTLGFSFNPASQITTRTTSNDSYAWTNYPTTTVSYTRNGLNQYASVAGTMFSYDARGNLTGTGARTYGYDLENRLTSVAGSASMALAYDPLGRLNTTTVSSVATTYLYAGDNLTSEYNGTTLLRRYVPGAGTDEPLVWYEGSALTTRNWLHANNQGSVIATSDGAGAGTIYAYGPYGEPNAWGGSRFAYTGQIALPEVQLYHYKARVYDPALGRFLQTDPIGYEADANLYAYVGNSPIDEADPDGMTAWTCAVTVTDGKVTAAQCQSRDDGKRDTTVTYNVHRADHFLFWTFTSDRSVTQSYTPNWFTQNLLGGDRGFIGRGIEGLTGNEVNLQPASAPATSEPSPAGSRRAPMDVPRGTNSSGQIGGRAYTGHALDEMQSSGIPPSAVENAIRTGTPSADPIPGRTRFYDPINRVTVVTDSASGRVITVHPGGR